MSSAAFQQGAKRHKASKKKPVINGISKPAVKRLARRGGVKRISGNILDAARNFGRGFLDKIVRDALIVKGKRKTVMLNDVLYALKRNDRTLLSDIDPNIKRGRDPHRGPNTKKKSKKA